MSTQYVMEISGEFATYSVELDHGGDVLLRDGVHTTVMSAKDALEIAAALLLAHARADHAA